MQASATLPALVLLGEAANEHNGPPKVDVQVGLLHCMSGLSPHCWWSVPPKHDVVSDLCSW